jgi:SAM-dependent methyltransferase/GNAT superfamily N-acetyltransferase
VEILRDEGARALCFSILADTVYRRLVLMDRRLDQPIPDVAVSAPIVVELLGPAHVDEYRCLRADIEPAEFRRRLALGHWCFAVRHGDRLVHAGWAAAHHARIDFLDTELTLAPGEVYQYDSFTAPDARGRGFAVARLTAMARHLQDAGYRRLIAAVVPENTVAFRPLQKAGYRIFGLMGVVRVGRFRRWFLRRRGQASPDGRAGHGYWDSVLTEMQGGAAHDEWRAYMQRVYRKLVTEWLPAPAAGRGLKTDLFEEAVSEFHLLPDLGAGAVGIDVSPSIVAAARHRLARAGRRHLFVVADLRHIPLRAGSIASILAGSSLDHFPAEADIVASLRELTRILRTGGTLVVTFDNPQNPVVGVRNRLPFAALHRIGVVPYYVGATYGVAEARAALTACGLDVTAATAVAHAPRLPAMWLASLAERARLHRLRARLARMLDRCETLGRWPTRYRTGYYVAVRAEKRDRRAPIP